VTTTLQRPPSAPDAGVIEEARKRQHRHRAAATAVAILAGVSIGAAIWSRSGGAGNHEPGAGRSHAASAPAASKQRSQAACASLPSNGLRGAPSHALLSILGVLRRPATSADRLPTRFASSDDPFVRYVRRTRMVDGTAYYLYPALIGCRPRHEGLMELTTNVNLGGGTIGATGGGGAGAQQIEAGEDVSTGPPGSATSATITMIVPDGVATVTLEYPAGRASGYSPKISPPFTVTTRPVGNEVVVRVPRSAGGGPIGKPTMTWRAGDGHILRTFHRL
jgi:hypothetical protein